MKQSPTQRDSQIPIGVVGGGAAWAASYWPAISLLKRGRVVAAYSPQCEEAELLSQALAVPHYHSLREMLRRSRPQALLVLEQGNSRDWALQLSAEFQIPALIASPIDDGLPNRIARLVEYEADGAALIPGLMWRMTPATLRLRELMATRLGAIQQLRFDLFSPEAMHLIGVIDWCRAMIGSLTTQITRSQCDGLESWQLTCGRRSPLARMVATEIVCHPCSQAERVFEVHVVCERGEARICGQTQIAWSTSSESAQEQLQGDRTAAQVLLDLFLRRVVGGVVPIPSWAELAESCRLWKTAVSS